MNPSTRSDPDPESRQLRLHYASSSPSKIEWLPVIYWLAGAAAVTGVFGTISFGLMFSTVLSLLQDLFSHHPWSRATDAVYVFWWLVEGASSLTLMWAAWWYFLRNPAAARTLQWGCIGLLLSWCFVLYGQLFGPHIALLRRAAKADHSLFFDVFAFIRRSINDATIPGILLMVAIYPATRKLIADARSNDGSIATPSEIDKAAAVTSAMVSEAGGFPFVAMARVRFCAGVMAMVIGAVQPVKAIVIAALFKTSIPWTTASQWSSRPLGTLEELLRSATGLILLAGGWAALKHHRFGRRIILFGSGATILMLLYDAGLFYGPWDRIFFRTAIALTANLRVLTALVLLIGLFNCRAMRIDATLEHKSLEASTT